MSTSTMQKNYRKEQLGPLAAYMATKTRTMKVMKLTTSTTI